jgi:uncharacterized protein with ParB-like and HNH nuclease domain
VWTIKQASLLIESFLLGLPVPQVFLYVDDDNHNLLIDGQQRITSVVYYLDGYFGEAKHKILGSFATKHFDRINGRIGLRTIREDYLPRFGAKYEQRFSRRLEEIEKRQLRHGQSVKASYGNLLTWRNSFAHEGVVPSNATYDEVKRAYACGKRVMNCLAGCMVR